MAIQAMRTAIKNNNLMRSKRDKFKRGLGGYSEQRKTEYDLPNATTKQLNDIRKRLKEERNYRMFKVTILTILLFLGLVFISFYIANAILDMF